MPLPENMRRIREERGLTQEKVAEKLGIKQSQIVQYEKGMKVPNGVRLVDIAKVLGTTAEELVR